MRKLQNKHLVDLILQLLNQRFKFLFVGYTMLARLLFYMLLMIVCTHCLFMTLFKWVMEQNFSRFSCWFLNSGIK